MGHRHDAPAETYFCGGWNQFWTISRLADFFTGIGLGAIFDQLVPDAGPLPVPVTVPAG